MSFASAKPEPPFYLLLQHTNANSSAASSSAPANFSHPLIEYHFADDPASALLPTSADERVIVLDYDSPASAPVVQSLHADFAVASVKVTDAPGAAAAASRDGESTRNDKMYIIETIAGETESGAGDSLYELDNPQLILTQFKERNTVLRRILDHQAVKSPSEETSTASLQP
ncbi:hypothetical protein DFH11DRAFT_1721984 [Phellopilus nigrolimitatus]|nr:hypothetical protein DFH11DRAFT_1721984 [Phellopilus nigrolimitatus]